MKRALRYLLPAVAAVALGGIIYIFLRPPGYAFIHWLDASGVKDLTNQLKGCSLFPAHAVPGWVVYSLPNALWAFSYSLIITGIWFRGRSGLKYFWLASIPFLVTGFELLQLTGTIPGTFCPQDMVLGITGMISGFLAGLKLTNPNNHERSTTF